MEFMCAHSNVDSIPANSMYYDCVCVCVCVQWYYCNIDVRMNPLLFTLVPRQCSRFTSSGTPFYFVWKFLLIIILRIEIIE